MSDQSLASAWIGGVLNGDATLNAIVPKFYPRKAPVNATLPYGIYQNMSTVDWNGATAAVYMAAEQMWSVTIIGAGNTEGGTLDTAVSRIHSVLYAVVPITVSRGIVLGCTRAGTPPTFVETVNGIDYTHIGVGMYRIITQDATMAALADLP